MAPSPRTASSVDDIAITGQPADGAETDPGWTYVGFLRTSGVVTQSFFNMYIAENRTYWGYDKSLKTGPYNFGFLDNPKPSELGRALPVPAGPPGLVLRHLVPGQQRR